MDPQRLDPVDDRELVLEVDGAAGEVAGERGGDDRPAVALVEGDRVDRVKRFSVSRFHSRTASIPVWVCPSSSTTAPAAKQATAASSLWSCWRR